MIEIKILPANRWSELRDLRLEALRTEPTAFGSSVEEEEIFTEEIWRERTRHALVALSDDKPIGTVTYILNNRPKTGHIAHIYGFYVTPSFRGQGIGRTLLETTLRNIQDERKDVIKVQLMANKKQEAAVALYKKLGFLIVGELRKELKVGNEFYDEFIMEKMLP
jgi:ribosomal protein S18 acetylase RimI-like enzyme